MKNSWLHTLLRDPLLHFLLIGSALFVAYDIQNKDFVENNRIIISEAEIDQLIMLWEKKRQRLPTQVELQGLIEQQVREEVMYREAIAMGLDQNDRIVRRRLAQKVEFISADLASLAEPTETKLADYLVAHREQFEQPARIDFMQVYIDLNKHGDNIQNYTADLLHKLRKASPGFDVETIGDSLMLDRQYNQLTEHEVSRLFGKQFAGNLFALPVGSWQGPIYSGYGLHLIRIDKKIDNQLPELKKIRDKVQAEWFAQQRRIMDESFYQGLRQRYKIVIEKYSEKEIVTTTK
ncbi:MAG: peptidyl-prolyl cis-trans isomerase [Pseudomonadales bacterium]|nr:peptidyl-prolyl cis-trans isomerase [Pseudomonadales bacterium]